MVNTADRGQLPSKAASQCGSVVGNTGSAVDPILTARADLHPAHYSLSHRLRHNLGLCHKASLGYHCKGYEEC